VRFVDAAGAEGTREVPVAKPPALAVATWDGETVDGWLLTRTGVQSRTASQSGEADQLQEISPPYAAGDVLIIAHLSGAAGGTGVLAGEGSDALWQDLNVDARRWSYPC
jgi:hypothetical protein